MRPGLFFADEGPRPRLRAVQHESAATGSAPERNSRASSARCNEKCPFLRRVRVPDQCGHRAYTYQSTSGAVDFGVRRRYLAIRRLRLATVSGISGANGAVAEWLKAAVC